MRFSDSWMPSGNSNIKINPPSFNVTHLHTKVLHHQLILRDSDTLCWCGYEFAYFMRTHREGKIESENSSFSFLKLFLNSPSLEPTGRPRTFDWKFFTRPQTNKWIWSQATSSLIDSSLYLVMVLILSLRNFSCKHLARDLSLHSIFLLIVVLLFRIRGTFD